MYLKNIGEILSGPAIDRLESIKRKPSWPAGQLIWANGFESSWVELGRIVARFWTGLDWTWMVGHSIEEFGVILFSSAQLLSHSTRAGHAWLILSEWDLYRHRAGSLKTELSDQRRSVGWSAAAATCKDIDRVRDRFNQVSHHFGRAYLSTSSFGGLSHSKKKRKKLISTKNYSAKSTDRLA